MNFKTSKLTHSFKSPHVKGLVMKKPLQKDDAERLIQKQLEFIKALEEELAAAEAQDLVGIGGTDPLFHEHGH